jgi:hypothetical protein
LERLWRRARDRGLGICSEDYQQTDAMDMSKDVRLARLLPAPREC